MKSRSLEVTRFFYGLGTIREMSVRIGFGLTVDLPETGTKMHRTVGVHQPPEKLMGRLVARVLLAFGLENED